MAQIFSQKNLKSKLFFNFLYSLTQTIVRTQGIVKGFIVTFLYVFLTSEFRRNDLTDCNLKPQSFLGVKKAKSSVMCFIQLRQILKRKLNLWHTYLLQRVFLKDIQIK